jgi:hypothetical protein
MHAQSAERVWIIDNDVGQLFPQRQEWANGAKGKQALKALAETEQEQGRNRGQVQFSREDWDSERRQQ